MRTIVLIAVAVLGIFVMGDAAADGPQWPKICTSSIMGTPEHYTIDGPHCWTHTVIPNVTHE